MQSNAASVTRAIGERLAGKLQPGDVLLLRGNLGAGKSELTRGIARGLGIEGVIPSPSFTILNVYMEGCIPLYHFDWYRITSVEELYEMGMDEYIGGDGICVIEWPDNGREAIPDTYLEIFLDPTGDTQREIRLVPRGGFRNLEIESGEDT